MLYRLTQICWHSFFWLWELPQNLLGVFVLLYFVARGSVKSLHFDRARLFIETRNSGVSLGYFIFWCTEYPPDPMRTRQHEYGHSIQSRLLGPLYLPMVGIPSYLRFLYARGYYSRHGRLWPFYYQAFPEDWADRLGKVRRAGRPR